MSTFAIFTNLKTRYLRASTPFILLLSFMMTIVCSLWAALAHALSLAHQSLQTSLFVLVLFPTTIPDVDARRSADSLPSLDAAIRSVEFISKEDAIKSAESDEVLSKSLMVLKDNPLPPSALVRLDDAAWLERADPSELLRQIPEIAEIRWDAQLRSLFQSIHGWHEWVLRLGWFMAGLAAGWAAFGLFRFFLKSDPFTRLLDFCFLGLLGGLLAVAFFSGSQPMQGAFLLDFPKLNFWPAGAGLLTGLACLGWNGRTDV